MSQTNEKKVLFNLLPKLPRIWKTCSRLWWSQVAKKSDTAANDKKDSIPEWNINEGITKMKCESKIRGRNVAEKWISTFLSYGKKKEREKEKTIMCVIDTMKITCFWSWEKKRGRFCENQNIRREKKRNFYLSLFNEVAENCVKKSWLRRNSHQLKIFF